MRHYLIRDTSVTVLSAAPETPSADAVLIDSVKSLDARRFPLPRLLAIYNALSGVSPVKRFTDRAAGVRRVWGALENMPISSAKADSKKAKMIGLLKRADGASMEELIKATGWQRHSIRGMMSGVLRKKLGLSVSHEADGDRHIYRISA